MSRGVDENSELFRWIRVMATTLLAAIVCRLIYSPAAALEQVPLAIRTGSIVTGVGAFFLLRRSLVLGILAGEAFFVLAAWIYGA